MVAPVVAPRQKVVKLRKPVNELGVVDQVRQALIPRNRFATACGFLLGGFVPSAVFTLVHYEVAAYPWLWALVVGGLIYSALTVFKWGSVAFSSGPKAFGFVLLIEGTLTFAHTAWLSAGALGFLVAINGLATGINLIANQKEHAK